MARKRYTIFILPHAQARFRKIHLSRNFLICLGVVVAAVLAAGAFAPHLLLKVQAQSDALVRLKKDNQKLREEKIEFEASLAEMGAFVTNFEERARRFARAVGLEHLPVSDLPTGGRGPGKGAEGIQGMLDEEMASLRSRSRNLEKSFDGLDAAMRAREQLLASTPYGMPVEGFYSHGFGWRNDPLTGEREFHQGMDIVAPMGTPIRAPADGVVTTAARMPGYGKMLHISHGYGYATRYGHLSEILVRHGQRVRRGDILGRVGSTGHSTGPHLHYEIFKAGRRVNPARYLATRAS